MSVKDTIEQCVRQRSEKRPAPDPMIMAFVALTREYTLRGVGEPPIAPPAGRIAWHARAAMIPLGVLIERDDFEDPGKDAEHMLPAYEALGEAIQFCAQERYLDAQCYLEEAADQLDRWTDEMIGRRWTNQRGGEEVG